MTTDIFILYSQQDQDILDKLKTHLVALERAQPVKIWYDGMIEAGSDWQLDVQKGLDNAEIILMLVSADFIASDYLFEQGMTQALARNQEGKAKAIPIIARPCLWKDTALGALSPLPKNEKAITSNDWDNDDEPYLQIVETLAQVTGNRKKQYAQTPTNSYQSTVSSPSPSLLKSYKNYIIAGLCVLIVSFAAWKFTQKQVKAKTIDKAVLAHSYELYNLYIEQAEEELKGENRLDNYIMARADYQMAVEIMKPVSADTVKAHEGIMMCNRQIERDAQGRKIDKEYVAALKRFREYLIKGNQYFLGGLDFVIKKDTSKAKDNYYQAKNSYNNAIRAGGDFGVEVGLAQRGRYQCEEAIAAISYLNKKETGRIPAKKDSLSKIRQTTVTRQLLPELVKYANIGNIHEKIRITDSIAVKTRP